MPTYWTKLPLAIATSLVLQSCPRDARGLYWDLFARADDAGRIALAPGLTPERAAQLASPDLDKPDCSQLLTELDRKQLVVVTDAQIFIPARVTASNGSQAGDGSRGGKSATERSRELRERRRSEGATGMQRDATANATAPATGRNGTCNGDATGESVACNGDATGSATGRSVACNGDATANATGHMVTQRAVNASVFAVASEMQRDATGSATGHATEAQRDATFGATETQRVATADRKKEEREEKETEERKKNATGVPVAPTSTSVPSSARSKARKPDPVPDPVPEPGTLARKIYDFVLADPGLRGCVEGPGDFAVRASAPDAFPGVNVLSEVHSAAEWLRRNPGRWTSRAGLVTWLRRSAQEAAARPRPAGAEHSISPEWRNKGPTGEIETRSEAAARIVAEQRAKAAKAFAHLDAKKGAAA